MSEDQRSRIVDAFQTTLAQRRCISCHDALGPGGRAGKIRWESSFPEHVGPFCEPCYTALTRDTPQEEIES